MSALPRLLQNPPSPGRRMRLAVVTETYPPEVNGVALTIARMVTALRARGHRIQLIRPRQEPDDQPASAPGFEEVLTPGMPIPGYPGLRMGAPAKSALARLWQHGRPDVVHVVTEGPLGWSAVSAARRLGLPVTTDFHTNFHTYSRHYGLGLLRLPIHLYLRWLHNRAQRTLVPTDALRSELHGLGYRNLATVARGVDGALFTPSRRSPELRRSWGAGEGDLVAVCVGRLAPEKNLPLAVEAFHRMRAVRPGTKLVMVGDGPARAALQRLHPDVAFAGSRTGEDLARHYASADLFLFPSTTETYGNVTLEAMASRLAVVAYDYAAAGELIRHGDNGLLARFNVPADFVARAEWLAANPGSIFRLGFRARRTAEALDWDIIHDRFEQILADTVQVKEPRHDDLPRLPSIPD